MLEVGLSYLDEIVNRCMVQATIPRFSRRVMSCRLHDLMHEFCLSKAREENFSKDFLGFEQSMPSSSASSSSSSIMTHRLSVYLKDTRQREAISVREGQDQHVRSCLCYGEKVINDGDEIQTLIKGFKFLKVFKLDGYHYQTSQGYLLEDIGKLIHLRYLRVPRVKGLPSSVGNLILLQSLDLLDFAGKIPDVLWKLKELRHLYLPFDTLKYGTKLRLDGLGKLETLINLNTGCSDVGDLATLPNLRKLHIYCIVKKLVKIFELPMFTESNSLLRRSTFRIGGVAQTRDEHDLLSQILACSHVTKFSLSGIVYEEVFLQNLNAKITKIFLSGCGLKKDPMPILGMMPNLRKLSLIRGSYTGKKMSCLAPKKTTEPTSSGSGSFPQLTLLWLSDLDISEWKVEEGAMPCLSLLSIHNCTELKEIPDGLRFIATLQKLWISGATESMKQRVQEGGEDFPKIQHVPSFKMLTITRQGNRWCFTPDSSFSSKRKMDVI